MTLRLGKGREIVVIDRNKYSGKIFEHARNINLTVTQQ